MKLQPRFIHMYKNNFQVPSKVLGWLTLQVDTQKVISEPFNRWANFKSQIKANLRPIFSQARYPRVTCNTTKKSNTVNSSYYVVFILKSKIHMEDPMRESENIPNWDTYIVLQDSCFILNHHIILFSQKILSCSFVVFLNILFCCRQMNPQLFNFYPLKEGDLSGVGSSWWGRSWLINKSLVFS